MYPEVTSVYVPVKTPDYKGLAWLLSVLVHGLLIGLVVYFHHQAPPAPMETSLVTPEQLADIESQIRANQQNSQDTGMNTSGDAMGATSTSDGNTAPSAHATPDAQTARMMRELAAKEAAWQKEKAKFDKQLDQQISAENQQLIEEINTEQAQIREQLQDFKVAEDSQDADRQQRIEELEAAQKALDARRAQIQDVAPTKKVDLAKTGESTANSGNTGIGNPANTAQGQPKKGSSNGGSTASYVSAIRNKIMRNWDTPKNSAGQKLTANIRISRTGDVQSISFTGNATPAFEASLRQAINASNPLPMPDDPSFYDSFGGNISLNFSGQN